jgi:hypothetical protein
MTAKLPTLLLFLFALTPGPLSAQVPVRLTGHSAADDTLQTDIVKTIALYGGAFHCPPPSEITASMLNSSMIPSSLRKPSLSASYEHWDATFCTKHYSFFVTFFPDPNGGSFLSVSYPYPTNAPR